MSCIENWEVLKEGWGKNQKDTEVKFEGIPTGHVWDNLIVTNFNPLSKVDIQSKQMKRNLYSTVECLLVI